MNKVAKTADRNPKIIHKRTFQSTTQCVELVVKSYPKPSANVREVQKPFKRDCLLKNKLEEIEEENDQHISSNKENQQIKSKITKHKSKTGKPRSMTVEVIKEKKKRYPEGSWGDILNKQQEKNKSLSTSADESLNEVYSSGRSRTKYTSHRNEVYHDAHHRLNHDKHHRPNHETYPQPIPSHGHIPRNQQTYNIPHEVPLANLPPETHPQQNVNYINTVQHEPYYNPHYSHSQYQYTMPVYQNTTSQMYNMGTYTVPVQSNHYTNLPRTNEGMQPTQQTYTCDIPASVLNPPVAAPGLGCHTISSDPIQRPNYPIPEHLNHNYADYPQQHNPEPLNTNCCVDDINCNIDNRFQSRDTPYAQNVINEPPSKDDYINCCNANLDCNRDQICQTRNTPYNHNNGNESIQEPERDKVEQPSQPVRERPAQRNDSTQTQSDNSPYGHSALQFLHLMRERLTTIGDQKGGNLVDELENHLSVHGSGSGAGNLKDFPAFTPTSGDNTVFHRTPATANENAKYVEQVEKLLGMISRQKKIIDMHIKRNKELQEENNMLITHKEQLTKKLTDTVIKLPKDVVDGNERAGAGSSAGLADSGVDMSSGDRDVARLIQTLQKENEQLKNKAQLRDSQIIDLKIELARTDKKLDEIRIKNRFLTQKLGQDTIGKELISPESSVGNPSDQDSAVDNPSMPSHTDSSVMRGPIGKPFVAMESFQMKDIPAVDDVQEKNDDCWSTLSAISDLHNTEPEIPGLGNDKNIDEFTLMDGPNTYLKSDLLKHPERDIDKFSILETPKIYHISEPQNLESTRLTLANMDLRAGFGGESSIGTRSSSKSDDLSTRHSFITVSEEISSD